MKTENYFLKKKKKRVLFTIKSFSNEVNFQKKKKSTYFTNYKLGNNRKSTENKFIWTNTRLKFRIKIALM